jgi:type IX secretion system PorP/SprF family membrane protein
MKKILLLISLGLVAISALQAQRREAIFNHYYITPVLVNPAAAGFSERHQLQFNARAQWTGFADAPKTLGAMYNGPIGKTFGVGVGLFADRAANVADIRAILNYAFRFGLGENIKVSAGFSTEFIQETLDNSVRNSNFLDVDPLVDQAIEGRRTIDAAVAVFSRIHDNTFVGLTFGNLVGGRLDNLAGSETTNFFQHYSFLLGHRFDLSDLNFTLEPSMMVRQVKDTPFQVDFNVRAGFLEDKLISGLSYRTLGVLSVLLGTTVSNFQLFYSYDASFQNVQSYHDGTHEVTVALSFGRGGPGRSNPYVR